MFLKIVFEKKKEAAAYNPTDGIALPNMFLSQSDINFVRY